MVNNARQFILGSFVGRVSFFSLVFMPLKDIKLANSIFCNANWCVRSHITVFRGGFFTGGFLP